ncbi:MAG: hypothetical protein KVP17_004076 [Porospora cf. gigantea B]|uniref:uncharacterized protein n=1 Tax=Porospora cf. gigantea B TaxID=2853592 RepID=UPI003571C6BE|nr:MAG: hypothetical protein KVP17_004076 [Porospora cf. gigantea B]
MTRFVFTDQDTTDDHIAALINWLKLLSTVIYAIIGKETSPSTGHLHLQGFVNVHGLKWNAMKKRMPKACIELAKGTDMQNHDYCSKENVIFEKGKPSTMGKRNDLETIYADIEGGMAFQSLVLKHRSSVFRYERIIRSMMANRRRIEVEQEEYVQPKDVCIFFGTTGTGKTTTARAEAVGALYQVFNPRWFDGYEDGHHRTLLFDEFNGQHPIEDILQLTDRWPVTREIKGGTTIVHPAKVIFTSNVAPQVWFPQATPSQKAAFFRRVTDIRHFIDTLTVEPIEPESMLKLFS